MSEPVPVYAQEAYAILKTRFAAASFPSDYLSWFISGSMVKKTLHVLERAGWIRRTGRGEYTCVNPDDIFSSMVAFKVPKLLQEAGMRYVYSGASAVELWTDYSYIQRSWEHSAYYVGVLGKELKHWTEYFRKHRVRAFISSARPSLGEFVVLIPRAKLISETHNGLPVEPLKTVVSYCEKYIDAFDSPLAYLKSKFKIKSKVEIDKRVLVEAAKAVA